MLERGCRTVAVFSPTPLAGYWEEAKYMPKDGKQPRPNRGEKAYASPATSSPTRPAMELPKPKLTHADCRREGRAEAGVTRSKFKAGATEDSTASRNRAPAALRNLMGYLRENARLDVALEQRRALRPATSNCRRSSSCTCTAASRSSSAKPTSRTSSRTSRPAGCCSRTPRATGYEQWKEFDKSFRETCAKLFPDKKLVVIQDDRRRQGRPAVQDRTRGRHQHHDRAVPPRDAGRQGTGAGDAKTYPVLLEGIKIDGRWVVIYSKYDIGCAIEGHKAADCLGHDKDSALPHRVGRRAVLAEAVSQKEPRTRSLRAIARRASRFCSAFLSPASRSASLPCRRASRRARPRGPASPGSPRRNVSDSGVGPAAVERQQAVAGLQPARRPRRCRLARPSPSRPRPRPSSSLSHREAPHGRRGDDPRLAACPSARHQLVHQPLHHVARDVTRSA